jgi:hypothetical protein
MKRAIVEGPRRKIAGLRQAPQSVVVMDVNGAIFPRQVRMLSALAADDLALQGSFEVALDLTIWPDGLLGIPRLMTYVERLYAIGSISLPPLKA